MILRKVTEICATSSSPLPTEPNHVLEYLCNDKCGRNKAQKVFLRLLYVGSFDGTKNGNLRRLDGKIGQSIDILA